MSNKIEFIDIDGKNYRVELFPESVRNLITTFEVIRDEYNKSAVTTAALGDYMNRTSGDIQAAAKNALQAMLNPETPAVDAVAGDE